MITRNDRTYTRQKRFIYLVLFVLLAVPIGLTLSWYWFEWPELQWKRVGQEHYAERISLLRYIISVGLSIIGATWFLASNTASRISPTDANYRQLSWAWTLLGVAVLAAFVELYFSYKGYYSWYVNLEDVNISDFKRVRYYWVHRASSMSYLVCDTCFFLGAVVLILAVIRALNLPQSK